MDGPSVRRLRQREIASLQQKTKNRIEQKKKLKVTTNAVITQPSNQQAFFWGARREINYKKNHKKVL